MVFGDVSRLDDLTLLARVVGAQGRCNRAVAELLVHLAEVDERRLHAREGFSSMHAYCVEALGMSEGAAYKRIAAARVGRRFPTVVEAVGEGRLHLSAVALLAPRLTEENHRALMADAFGKSKREVEKVVARWFPRADAVTSVRRLPVRKSEQLSPGTVGLELKPSPPTPKPEPLSEGRFKVTFTGSQALVEKLEQAKALMSHANPDGDVATVVERALDVLVEQLTKRRFGADAVKPEQLSPGTVDSPPAKSAARTRYIPAAVRAAVYKRDEGCCSFVSPSGRRCESRRFLELHHEEPYARGGAHTESCLTLRCRLHNDLAAIDDFGEAHIRRHVQQRQQTQLLLE